MFAGARSVVIGVSVSLAGLANAQSVQITQDLPFYEFEAAGVFHVIERDQDTDAVIEGPFAKTSRACPPFCIAPMQVHPQVQTVGELELIEFIENHVASGNGLLVDSRLEDWYRAGTIPGAVNIPFNIFTPDDDNPFLTPFLGVLGVRQVEDGIWDFAQARDLLLFCNGPWCDQSPRALRNLIALGYPPEKLRYYRGGMQNWSMLGLTVTKPQNIGG